MLSYESFEFWSVYVNIVKLQNSTTIFQSDFNNIKP